MKRINVMVSDDAKIIAKNYQEYKNFKNLDDAIDSFLLEHGDRFKHEVNKVDYEHKDNIYR